MASPRQNQSQQRTANIAGLQAYADRREEQEENILNNFDDIELDEDNEPQARFTWQFRFKEEMEEPGYS